MDQLSLSFSEASALKAVESCTDIEELRAVTRSLVRGHFESRRFIDLLMRQSMQDADRRRCVECPKNVW